MANNHKKKHHGFVFFTQDYFGAIDVRLLPLDIRMVWVEAFFLMDLSPRRGVLLQPNGQPYTFDELAETIRGGATAELIERAFKIVIEKQIASKDRGSGQIMNRKMVRDEMRSKSASISGRKGGGNPVLGTSGNQSKQKDLFETDKDTFKAPYKLARAIPDPDPDPVPDLNSSPSQTFPEFPHGSSFENLSPNTEHASSTDDLAPHEKRGARKRDEAFDFFAAEHKEKTGAAYVRKSGDFVQLAALRKANAIPALAMPEKWQDAVANFFASPMASYSLADLCARFPVFRNSPLDGFKNPINHQNNNRNNSNGARTKPNRTAEATKAVLRRMDQQDIERDERGPDRSDGRGLHRAPTKS